MSDNKPVTEQIKEGAQNTYDSMAKSAEETKQQISNKASELSNKAEHGTKEKYHEGKAEYEKEKGNDGEYIKEKAKEKKEGVEKEGYLEKASNAISETATKVKNAVVGK